MSTIYIPIEIWMIIIDHIKMDSKLDIKEKSLNQKEHNLNIQSEHLANVAGILERNLNEASDLINNLGQIQNNLSNTIKKVDNFLLETE